jgi:hypothetical protein
MAAAGEAAASLLEGGDFSVLKAKLRGADWLR